MVLHVLLIFLAAYRLTRFILDDRLPARTVAAIQDSFEARWERRHPTAPPSDEYQSSLAYLLSCPWCFGFWVSAAVSYGTQPVTEFGWAECGLVTLASSAATGLLSYFEHTLDATHDLNRARLRQIEQEARTDGQD